MTPGLRKKLIRDFSRAAKTYDNYAQLQRKVAEHLFLTFTNTLSSRLDNTVNSENMLLDIGCGTGYFHELLRKNKIYSPLIQTDISPQMCNIAASYASLPEYGKTYTIIADLHNLPFVENSFAAIFSSMTMQWSHDLSAAFAGCANMLAKNGVFAASIVGDGSLFELKEAFLLAGYNPPIHTFASLQEINTKIEQAGFTIQTIRNENITLYYADIYSLLRSIKNVGASYKGDYQGGLRNKDYFKIVEAAYRNKFEQAEGLPLSWNIIYVNASSNND